MRKLSSPAVSIVFSIALMGFFSGCKHQPSDDAIAKDIQQKVTADPDTKDSQVSVAAKDGKVTITGTTKSAAAKQKVEQIASAEPGETGVDDQSTVQPETAQAPDATQPAAAPAPAPTPAPAPAPPVEQPKPLPIVIPAGTVLTVRTIDALSSKNSQEGQSFMATLAQPVSVHGNTVFPKGASVSGTVVTAKAKGKIKGEGELSLALVNVSTAGQTYRIHTDVNSSAIKGKGKRTAGTTGGGAAGGALIGGLAGGGKGAGIGALVGAGAGFVGGAFTGNKQIEIPSESVLSFTLSQSLTIPPPGQ